MRCQSSGHDVPFCLYVTTGLVQCTVEYWWGALTRLVARAERIELSVLGMKGEATVTTLEKKRRTLAWLQAWVHAAVETRGSPRSSPTSACPPGHRPDRPRGHSTDSKWPSDPRPRPTRFDSPSRQPPLACTRPRSQNAPDPAPRTDESPDKSPILDRPLAPLTTHRSIRTLPPSEKGRLKFLYLLYLSVTDSQNAMTGFPFSPAIPRAMAKEMAKTTICSTSFCAMASTMDVGTV